MSKIVELKTRKKNYGQLLEEHAMSVPDNIITSEVESAVVLITTEEGLVIIPLTSTTAYPLIGMLETAKVQVIDAMSK